MKHRLLMRSVLLMVVSLIGYSSWAQSESCGPITLELHDSYGDGWNGNDMDVISNSGTTTTYTLSSGSFTSYALTVAYGDTLEFSWQGGGSWASECTYIIKDASGNTLYSSPNGGSMTIGATQYYVYCNTVSTCAMPTNFSVTTGTTDAALSWDGASSYSYHLIEYDTAGFTPGTGDTMWVYADTAYISNLMSSTAYDFYLTTICSSTDSSITVSSMNTYTQCAAYVTPYTENFDNGPSGSYTNASMPNCWEYNSSTTYPYWYVRNYSFYANSGSQMVYGYKSSGTPNGTSYGDTAFFASPVIQGLDSATKQVEFYARTSSTSYLGMVLVGVTDANATTFNVVDTVFSTTAYAKYTVYLDAAAGVGTGDQRVAFAWIWDNSLTPVYDYVYIDDVTIKDIPPCPEPIGISLASATQTTATINWSSSSSAFNVEVGPTGFTQGTGASATTTSTSYTATGLSSNTYYDAYVMANCTATGDGTSNWVGPFTFKTECGDFAVPLTEGFENQTGGSSSNPDLPDCWTYLKTGTSGSFYAYVYNYSGYANTGTKSLRFYGYASTTSTASADGDTLAAMSPRIAGLGDNDKQVIFNVRISGSVAYYNSKIIIGTADTSGSKNSIHIVDTINYTATYDEYTVDLDNVPTTSSRVVFMIVPEFVSGYTYSYTYAYVDDIEIRDIPNCPIALNASGTATSDSSATLSWTDSSAVSNYIIEWGPTGFTQGTGAPMDTTQGNSWSVNTLDDATTYDFYIQSDCMSSNGSVSPWVGPITVQIPCSPTTTPFIESFENLAGTVGTQNDPNLPSCWIEDRGSAASHMRGMYNTYGAYAGNGYVEFWGLAMNSDTVLLSSPALSDLDEGKMVTFYSLVNSTSYLGEFQVGVSNFGGALGSHRALADIKLTTAYQEFKVYLDSTMIQPGDARVAFIFPEGNGQWNDIKMDSVRIEDMPSCITYNQMATNIIDTAADLTWSYTGNNCFNIEWGPAGFIQGTGVGAQAGTVDSNVTAPYTLNGLSPNTSYDFYVENCCNPGQWEGPFTFTTECTGPLAAGTYSVGATGDFATLDSVMSVLNTCGIAGSVTFEFQSGSFSSSSPIGAVSGVSATSTITFKGSPSVNDTLGALVLDGASYVTLEDLFIRSTGGHTIRLNGTDHITITGCTIDAGASTSTANIPITASADGGSYSMFTGGEEHLTLTNNTITGGYFGMTMYGSSLDLGAHHDITISGNDFVGQYYYGLYMYYGGRDVTITDNYFGQFTNTYNYAAYLYYLDGCLFSGNEVESYYSVLSYYMNTSNLANIDSEISNNMFKNGYYGMRLYYGANVGVYHNTMVGSTYGMYDYYNGSTVDYRNNIIQGGTYALYSYYSTATFDYNLYYSLGSNLGYIYNGSANYFTDLASLQAVDTTQNMNSLVGDPIFASATDFHVYGPLANDAGDNSVGISVDFDGDVRPSANSTTVDIGADEYDVVADDAALQALLSPSDGVCGSDSLMISVQIKNLGTDTISALTVSADVLGSTITQNLTGLSIPFGGTHDAVLGYVSNYVGGPMSIVAYTQLTGDGRSFNDTLSTNVEISDAQQVVPIAPEFACYGETVDLSIAHPTDGQLMWSNQQGDTLGLVAADSTISITITQDTTLTLSAEASQAEIQNYKGIGTAGGNYPYYGTVGVLFSATQSFMLDSVTLYPNAAGTTSVEIQDITTGTAVWTGSLTTTATGNNAEQVYVGAQVQPGNYRMVATASTTGGLYREYGVSGYPFSTPGGEVSVTQGTLTNYHYFFYNWIVTVGGCPREDSTFTISLHPDVVANISVDTANATISATDWTANWSTSGTSGADSIYVEFSNGTTSNDTSGTVTFTANMAGESVTVIAFGPCSSDTATFTFDVNQISVDEDFMNGTLSIYPNPTRGLFNVEFATAASKDVEISIVNMVGQVISSDVVSVNGVYQNQFDLSEASAGVYFITFKTDEGVLTERITVE